VTHTRHVLLWLKQNTASFPPTRTAMPFALSAAAQRVLAASSASLRPATSARLATGPGIAGLTAKPAFVARRSAGATRALAVRASMVRLAEPVLPARGMVRRIGAH